MKIDLFFIDVRELIEIRQADSMYFYNNKKIQKLKNSHQKKLSIAAAVLTNFCSELYSFDVKNIRISETGKPLIDNSSYHLSISHAGNFAVCGVANKTIGVDIEQVVSLNYQTITTNHFTTDEQTFLAENVESNRQALFFDLWVLKESFLKNTGLGLSVPLNTFDFVALNGQRSLFTVNQQINKKRYRSELLDFTDENYALACCIEV